jgi:hypothetical protein
VLGTQADLSVTSTSDAINNYDIAITESDLLGPQVTNVQITGSEPHNLFGLKETPTVAPPVGGPTPPITSLTISFQDLPQPPAPGNPSVALDPRTAGTIGNYEVRGDASGLIAIESVTVIHDVRAETVSAAVANNMFSAVNPTLAAAANFYNEYTIRFTSGVLAGQTQTVTAYTFNGATNTGTFTTTPFTATPAVNDTFELFIDSPTATVAAAPAPTATTLSAVNAAFSPTVDFYNNDFTLQFTSGLLSGQRQTITDYSFNPATNTGSFTTNAFPSAPAAGDAFVVLPIPSGVGFDQVILTFDSPLPDDRITVTVNDSVRDPAGNMLDGESNADEPNGAPVFPSGDGQPGGDFVARFTVDSRAELGVWSGGSVYIDTNGNFIFDPTNLDFSNRDIAYVLGFATDHIFSGNFTTGAVADGFDKLAAYGRIGSGTTAAFRWLIDFDNDGVPDPPSPVTDTANLIGVPVAGNFDGNAANGDEVGLFTGSAWIFDRMSKDFNLGNEGPPMASNMQGLPFVGDFDNDGNEDLGTYNPVNNTFALSLSTNGGSLLNGNFNVTNSFQLSAEVPFLGVREKPVAGDIDADGIDDIGLFVPDQNGVPPRAAADWYILVSGGAALTNRIVMAPTAVIPFTPTPFGNDLFASFGDQFGLPLLGNFDPPVTASAATLPTSGESTTTPISEFSPPPVDPINQPPTVAAPLGQLTALEDRAIEDIDLREVFADQEALEFSLVENSAPELVTGSIEQGVLRLQTFQNANGIATLVIEARDPEGSAVQDTLSLIVLAENDRPISIATAPQLEINEDESMIDVDLAAFFLDPEAQPLTYQLVGPPLSSSLVTAEIDRSSLRLSRVEGASGSQDLLVQATDPGGLSETRAIRVTVAAPAVPPPPDIPNRAPQAIGPVREIQVQQDADALQFQLDSIFSDADGDPLLYRVSTTNPSLLSPRLVDAALDVMFTAGQSGSGTVGVIASDPDGLEAQLELRIEVEPKSVDPEPVDPEPVDPEPDDPEPVDPEPVNPEPPPVEDPAPSPLRRLSLRLFLAR